MLNTNLPLMKRSIYQPAIGCSCGLHTWPTLLQSLCKYILLTQMYLSIVYTCKILLFYQNLLKSSNRDH